LAATIANRTAGFRPIVAAHSIQGPHFPLANRPRASLAMAVVRRTDQTGLVRATRSNGRV
jgi:hypothetical protein